MAGDTEARPRSRSRSPYRHERPYKRSRHHSPPHHAPRPLPLSAQPLSKHDLSRLRSLLSLYLDVQKQIDIDDIPEDEVRGRWKSFVKKWNNGDLAEGWYDPKTLEKALDADQQQHQQSTRGEVGDGSDEEDEFGPALPTIEPGMHSGEGSGKQAGAAAPSMDELRARREEADENARDVRKQQHDDLRDERRFDRRVQKERLNELVPKAEAGTRERQLEKKRELAASNKSFANAVHDGGEVDLKDSDVMGEDGVSEYKRMRQNEERKKNDRELRREEVLRARRAEREEKVRVLKEKEEKTMQYLKEIAKQRFG